MGKGKSNFNSNVKTKFNEHELNSMGRSELEKVAQAVFIKKNSYLSPTEAAYRAKSLMSGNTTVQLKKYIKKNG